jgi:hypothetical protein
MHGMGWMKLTVAQLIFTCREREEKRNEFSGVNVVFYKTAGARHTANSSCQRSRTAYGATGEERHVAFRFPQRRQL